MRYIFFLILLAASLYVTAQDWEALDHSPDQAGLELNPLKGIAANFGSTNNFPHSIAGLTVSLDSIMEGIDDFNWSVFEDHMVAEAAQGRFTYLQVNVDMGKPWVELPEFLRDDVNHFMYTPPNGNGNASLVVDYNDEDLMLAMLNFIQRFGDEYGDDDRLFLVHYGLYGIFGEWDIGAGAADISTEFPGETEEDWEMSVANQLRITSAYTTAFPTKNLLARVPENVPEPQAVGYSDGLYFGASISEEPRFSFFFNPKLKSFGADLNWMNHVIGGEVDPHVQSFLWSSFPNIVQGDPDLIGLTPEEQANPNNGIGLQNTDDVFNTTHPTFIFQNYMLQSFFLGDEGGNTSEGVSNATLWANGLKAVKKMGYTFHIRKCEDRCSK